MKENHLIGVPLSLPKFNLRWQAMRSLATLGRLGWTGLICLVVALLVALASFPSMFKRLSMLQEEAAQERQRLISNGFVTEAPLPRVLNMAGKPSDFVAAMQVISLREGICIERIDYQLLRETNKPVLQYRADLTAQGSYLQLRLWIDAILRERQNVALDELVFERNSPDNPQITARIRFTHFMRSDG